MSDNESKVPVTFKGLCRWANVPPQKAKAPYQLNPEEPNNCGYSIEVECSDEQFAALKKAGIPKLTEHREDEKTGLKYIRVKSSKVKGEFEFDDPVVVDKYKRPLTENIGNGSEVIVVAELAPIKGRKGSALRLKLVQVLNLIPYEGDAMSKYGDLLENNEVEAEEKSDEEVEVSDAAKKSIF